MTSSFNGQGFCVDLNLSIAVDSHSKWPEIYSMTSTIAAKTITVVSVMFARYGIPRCLVSDNGPQFVSEEFRQFMSVNGVKHIRSSFYHPPASNGTAKRVVQTVKQAFTFRQACWTLVRANTTNIPTEVPDNTPCRYSGSAMHCHVCSRITYTSP